MAYRIDYTKGQIINGLKFIEDKGSKNQKRVALFNCFCGNEFIAKIASVLSGNTKSCGCIHSVQLADRNRKHDLSGHRIYRIFMLMIDRCYNKNNPQYDDYGGRGIIICDEWRNDFMLFYNWSLANGYDKNLSIDRYPNNDGIYGPFNCRWATSKMQNNNRRKRRWTKKLKYIVP